MKFWEFLQKANSEDNGNPSTMRINMTFTVICLILSIVFGFVYVLIFWKDLIITYLYAIAGIIFMVFGFKNSQKKKESKVNNNLEG